MTPKATANDIVGSWRAPETEGVALGYYFYPDGVFILQDPRRKRFAMRGAWALDDDGRLIISDVIDPSLTRSEEERELIRSERHTISISEISPEGMVWEPGENNNSRVAFRRTGKLPGRDEELFWKRFFGVALFRN